MKIKQAIDQIRLSDHQKQDIFNTIEKRTKQRKHKSFILISIGLCSVIALGFLILPRINDMQDTEVKKTPRIYVIDAGTAENSEAYRSDNEESSPVTGMLDAIEFKVLSVAADKAADDEGVSTLYITGEMREETTAVSVEIRFDTHSWLNFEPGQTYRIEYVKTSNDYMAQSFWVWSDQWVRITP